jgi:ubiquitin C-terminal hydrolase
MRQEDDQNSQTSWRHPKQAFPNYIGLSNIGNSCYLNAAIQALYATYYMRDYFQEDNIKKISDILLKNVPKIYKHNNSIGAELKQKIMSEQYQPSILSDNEKNMLISNTLSYRLYVLFKTLSNKNDDNYMVITPSSFTRVFCNNQIFNDGKQHDSGEAFNYIINTIHEELATPTELKFTTKLETVKIFNDNRKKILDKFDCANVTEKKELKKKYDALLRDYPLESTIIDSMAAIKKHYNNNHSFISQLFDGFTLSTIFCPSCRYSNKTFELHKIIQLEIPSYSHGMKTPSIYDCLDLFTKEEQLDEENGYKCNSCEKKFKCIKRLKLWMSPPVMIFNFKRYSQFQTVRGNRMTKNNSEITFPTFDLDLSNYIAEENFLKDKCYTYDLYSIVSHVGGLNSGHYYTYSNLELSNKWVKFEDENVSYSNIENIKNDAYLVFYIRKDVFSNSTNN